MEVPHCFDLAAVRFVVDVGQHVLGLEDPVVVGERVAELGGLSVVGEHADDVVGAGGAGVDRADDAQDVGPVPFDPGQVDFAAGGSVEGPVVGGVVDLPELLVG